MSHLRLSAITTLWCSGVSGHRCRECSEHTRRARPLHTHCYWLLQGSTDGNTYESMRVAVVPDSRSVAALAGHCSGFSRLSFTPEIPKGGKKKVHEG